VAEWSVCWSHNLAVPGSIPALVTCTCRSCSLLFRVQILGHVCKEQTAAASHQLGFLILLCSVYIIILFQNYLSVVPVN